MHCHSCHSDGDGDPLEIAHLAEQCGLDFLTLTDHNNFSQQAVLNDIETHLMLIPGFEVTTYYDYGHWNVCAAHGWLDFRVQQLQAAIDEAVQRGYLVSCKHPRPQRPDWEFCDVAGYHCVEVWNGP